MKIKQLGLQDYLPVFEAMKAFTQDRAVDTEDEIWLLEHNPVFTQGQAGRAEHLLNPGPIPVVQSDRGGQVTYHGPGQLVAYFLFDIQRQNLGVRSLVCRLEQFIINFLSLMNIEAVRKTGAPGVYVEEKKIASIGLRVKQGRSYHGIALNAAMDLSPFARINPCGFAQLQMAQIQDFQPDVNMKDLLQSFASQCLDYFQSPNLSAQCYP